LNMANNVIAYVGNESFDIILYLSGLLKNMGYKVLLVDYSETKALTCSLPQIPGINTDDDYITYRKVDFTTKGIDHKILELYDDILIDCGMSCPHMDYSLLTRVVYVTDLFEFNLNRISKLDLYNNLEIETALLIRNAANSKLTTQYILSILKKDIPEEMITILYRDDADYENSLFCHYNKVFRFSHISWMMKNYLVSEVKILYKELTNRQIRLIYAKARKGE